MTFKVRQNLKTRSHHMYKMLTTSPGAAAEELLSQTELLNNMISIARKGPAQEAMVQLATLSGLQPCMESVGIDDTVSVEGLRSLVNKVVSALSGVGSDVREARQDLHQAFVNLQHTIDSETGVDVEGAEHALQDINDLSDAAFNAGKSAPLANLYPKHEYYLNMTAATLRENAQRALRIPDIVAKMMSLDFSKYDSLEAYKENLEKLGDMGVAHLVGELKPSTLAAAGYNSKRDVEVAANGVMKAGGNYKQISAKLKAFVDAHLSKLPQKPANDDERKFVVKRLRFLHALLAEGYVTILQGWYLPEMAMEDLEMVYRTLMKYRNR